jgi:hypothetical protein
MLMLLQQAAQHAPVLSKQVGPNLYVALQPPPAGMPEWEKTLFAAAVCAIFGLLDGLVMEYAKPWITHRRTRTEVREIGNLTALDASSSLVSISMSDKSPMCSSRKQ